MIIAAGLLPVIGSTAGAAKTSGVFSTPALVEKAKANAAKYPWAADIQKKAVDNARYWVKLSDDDLWDLMFGPTIPRSWMVWSNGFCPACKASVPMYNWKIDARNHPWKVQCPHCQEYFPKNDFQAFHRSGLDEHGVFDSKLADRSLLFNTEHPDSKDPLHMFGVDDGTGYMEGGNKWRFIGDYLIYGQWKQLIVNGVSNLGAAYALTGDPIYAHKAGILLDRVADLYPIFDFMAQAEVYEVHNANGYVSTWHDACGETRELALAYDRIFDGIKNDKDLVKFLAVKAKRYRLENSKTTFADVQRNIEDRILRDAMNNRKKIESNYPQTDLNFAMFKAILDWPASRDEVDKILGGIIDRGTAVDGTSGEKGMCCYASWAVRTLAETLEFFSRIDPGFLTEAFKHHPNLYKTWQFYIDTWCLQQYYPNVGDSTSFYNPLSYMGVGLGKGSGLNSSMYTFLYHLYQVTKDPAYMQIAYLGNDKTVDGMPYDILADDPAELQKTVKEVVDREGLAVKVQSANKEQWHLAMLRSGEGDNARVLWTDYDSTGPHSHADCMNLGLFAKGLDLMSDFGYPPVQYGGWDSPKANWFKCPAAHNTVVIDGGWQPNVNGKSTLWADGKQFRAIRTSAPQVAGKQYERTVAMVDISDSDSYVLDIFRAAGGTDHAWFMHSQLASLTSSGLSPKQGEDFGHGTFFRNTQTDAASKPGWSVDWAVDDQHKRGMPGPDVHLRYTGLTPDAGVSTCEAWVSLAINTNDEAWIPEVIVRRQAKDAPLASTFVGVIEPYYQKSNIASIRRLPLEAPSGAAYCDANAAVEVTLTDGRKDILIAADVENPMGLEPSIGADRVMVQKETGIKVEGELASVRLNKAGEVERVALCHGKSVQIGDVKLDLKEPVDFIEVVRENGKWRVAAGQGEPI